MLYRLLKFPARLALYFYCRDIKINKPEFLNSEGPLLIAANHPNSFLDAIIISSLFKKPIHSLVRGDVYKNKFYSALLYYLNMLPVYRVTEGVENLENNYDTFKKCKEIFKKNGIVLIFSEGRCINEWKLRPLMKGTARLAISSWEEDINLKILPLAINYDSFRSFGKIVEINFAPTFGKPSEKYDGYGKFIGGFNDELNSKLKPLVFEEDSKNKAAIEEHFKIKTSLTKKLILFIPAMIGFLIFSPVYYLYKKIITKNWNNDHFDSILVAGGFLIIPFYILLLTAIGIIIFNSWLMILLLIFLPFCAWSSLQLKDVFRS
ncbi:MAG: 1-acyl-sn-glycerol-3-phosphate acyltransferase [Ferruginibacter sp.]